MKQYAYSVTHFNKKRIKEYIYSNNELESAVVDFDYLNYNKCTYFSDPILYKLRVIHHLLSFRYKNVEILEI